MRRDKRVVLLSWPRTGSSSLWRILGAHPALTLMEDEPFNESITEWSPANPDYLSRIASGVGAFLPVLDELFRLYDGVKILDYQLDPEQVTALVTRADLRVIYLSRRNLLQTAVSDRIAKQVRVWNRWDVGPGEDVSDRYRSLQPLDIDDLRVYITTLRAHLAWIDTVLNQRLDPPVFRICYEDLFLAAPDRQHEILEALWAFLELEPVNHAALVGYLEHRNARLAGPETYRHLPNAGQINDLLGSQETGYLPRYTP